MVVGEFQAWKLGPVHPKLYYAVRHFGANPVQSDMFHAFQSVVDVEERMIIDDVVEALCRTIPLVWWQLRIGTKGLGQSTMLATNRVL